MQIQGVRGFVTGTGVITRADGTKVPFELKSEGLVSLEDFAEVCGQNPQAVSKIIEEGGEGS
jgi:hypothetical protein